MTQVIEVPENFWTKVTSLLDRKPEPEKVEVIPDDYEAAKVERDEYKMKLEAIEKAETRKAVVEKFETELKETKADPSMAELLADVAPETADEIMKQFRALSAQIDETQLTEEVGVEGEAIEDPKAAFNALVLKYSAENKVNYNQAMDIIKAEHYTLFVEAFGKKKE